MTTVVKHGTGLLPQEVLHEVSATETNGHLILPNSLRDIPQRARVCMTPMFHNKAPRK